MWELKFSFAEPEKFRAKCRNLRRLPKHDFWTTFGNVDAVRAKKSDRLQTVLSVNEVRLILDQFDRL